VKSAKSHKSHDPDFKHLYENLMIPITRTWRWCNAGHTRAFDAYNKQEDHTKANEVKASMAASKKAYKQLVKDQMDPRRLALGDIVKYTMHQGELQKIADQMSHSFTEVLNTMTAMNHGDNFCEDFEADFDVMQEWRQHQQVILDAIAHAEEHDGATGMSQADINGVKNYVKNMWRNVHKNFQCHFENVPEDKDAHKTFEALRSLMVKPSEHHSVFCHLNMLSHRADPRFVFTNKNGSDIENSCMAQLELMKGELSKMEDLDLIHKSDRKEIVNHCGTTVTGFFEQWKRVDDRLYDNKLQSTHIRKDESIHAAQEAAEVMYWFNGRGREAARKYKNNEVHGNYGAQLKEMADDFGTKCVREIRHVTDLLTPKYTVLEPSDYETASSHSHKSNKSNKSEKSVKSAKSDETFKTAKSKKSHDDNGKHIGQGEEADDHDFEHKNYVEPEGGNHDVEDHADQYAKKN
jgi:hypothetical protein